MTDDTTLSQDEINDLISGGSPVDDLESGIDGSGLLDSLTGKSSLGSENMNPLGLVNKEEIPPEIMIGLLPHFTNRWLGL